MQTRAPEQEDLFSFLFCASIEAHFAAMFVKLTVSYPTLFIYTVFSFSLRHFWNQKPRIILIIRHIKTVKICHIFIIPSDSH